MFCELVQVQPPANRRLSAFATGCHKRSDGQTGGPGPGMGANDSAIKSDRDCCKVCGDIDASAESPAVDGIVIRSHPDLVVPREPDPAVNPMTGGTGGSASMAARYRAASRCSGASCSPAGIC